MSTFLKCKGEAYFQLKLTLSYHESDGLKTQEVFVNSKNSYKITMLLYSEDVLRTYHCRIVGFTLANKPDNRALVNYDKDGNVVRFCEVDTIKIDASLDGMSNVITINVSDIRSIVEYSSNDFEDVSTIENFK